MDTILLIILLLLLVATLGVLYLNLRSKPIEETENKEVEEIEVRRKIEQVGLSFGKGFFRDGYESAKNVKTNTDGES